MSLEWEQLHHILAVRLDNTGDVIMLGPALMASPAGSAAAPLLPWLDSVFVHRALWQDIAAAEAPNPAAQFSLAAELAELGVDAAVIFTSFSQSPYPPAYACYLAGIPIRAGQSQEFGGGLLTHWVKPPSNSAHQVGRNLQLLRALGCDALDQRLEIAVPEAARSQAGALLAGLGLAVGEQYVLLAPGASCEARRYDPVRFGRATRLVTAASGLPVIVVGSPSERALAAAVLDAAGHPRVRSLGGETTVPELAALVEGAAVVLSNDSAAMHLADALGRPVVVTFSGTDLQSQWRPRYAPAVLLQQPTPCAPCYRFDCPFHLECLDIDPKVVAGAVLRLIGVTTAQSLADYAKKSLDGTAAAPHPHLARTR